MATVDRGQYPPSPALSGVIASPLTASALFPDTPVLSMAPTPVFTPQTGHGPSLFATHHHSPLSTRDTCPSVTSSPRPNSGKASLPLPGEPDQLVPPSIIEQPQPIRSDSDSSISSMRNEIGGHHLSTYLHELDDGHGHHQEDYLQVELPLQKFPTFEDSEDVAIKILKPCAADNTGHVGFEAPEPASASTSAVPRPKHASDPQLIPATRHVPLSMPLSQHFVEHERPISPFSPTHLTYPAQAAASGRAEASDPELDLIDFGSETNSTANFTQTNFDQSSRRQRTSSKLWQEGFTADDDDFFSSGSSGEEDEDELESHPLYASLSKSTSPYLHKAWETSKIVLVPPRSTLPPDYLHLETVPGAAETTAGPEVSAWERYTALHALDLTTESPNLYVGFGRTIDGQRLLAKVDSARGEVEVWLHRDSVAAATVETPFDGVGGERVSESPMLRTDAGSEPRSHKSDLVGSAIPSYLGPTASSSSTSSTESSAFPITPPTSPSFRPSISVRTASGTLQLAANSVAQGSTIAFPSIEETAGSTTTAVSPKLPEFPLSPSRRLKIAEETPVYRRKRSGTSSSVGSIGAAASAPSTLPQGTVSDKVTIANSTATDLPEFVGTPTSQAAGAASLSASLAATNRVVKKKDSKVKLRMPRWLGGSGGNSLGKKEPTNRTPESAPATPLAPHHAQNHPQHLQPHTIKEESQSVVEKLRILRVDGHVIEWPGQALQIEESPAVMARPDFQPDNPTVVNPGIQTARPPPSSRRSTQRRSTQSLSSSQMVSREHSGSSRFTKRSSAALQYRHSNASSTSQNISSAPQDFAG